ncbi:UNVERIFIED_CONTAM: hypothetical protein RMT77_011746 [Armadillidium vulgare]|nr:adenylate kinase [Armadillidium vulgare]RXG60311.1 GTP:AMP phosphotransferase AK3, mitochondrial [Armadillidium vulgare]RXG73347.1 GTP:AMP phosphotransferase AK3, mitochondrial [Armadillidium vulgare]
MFRMVILGAPGSGKGTISNRIIRDFALKHLSVGDVLRSHVNNKSSVGLEAESYMKAGKFVPDATMVKLISYELKRLDSVPWLLDGFPRNVSQAKMLTNISKLDLVLSLDVPNQIIIDRIKERWIHEPSGRIYNTSFNPPTVPGKDDVTGEKLTQRPDDAPEAVGRRLTLYSDNTKPILDFYAEKHILKEFRGTESNEIYPRVKLFLEEIIPNELHIKKSN